MKYVIALVLLAATVQAGELPPNAELVDKYGTWACKRGFVLRNHQCMTDAEVSAVPKVEVSELPSAGEGSATARACPSGGCPPPKGPNVTVIESETYYRGQPIGRRHRSVIRSW